MQRFYSDDHCERIAKTALRDKYGEDFEVRSMYSDHWSQFYATCVPADRNEVVFTALISKSGEVYKDDYLENVLGKQIEDIIYPYIEKMWPGTYIRTEQQYIKNT